MNINDFSSTQSLVINPVLHLRSSDLIEEGAGLKSTGFFYKEVISRIVSLTTSVFATVDFFFHGGVGVVSALQNKFYDKNSKKVTFQFQSDFEYFSKSLKFLMLAILGSVVCTIYPDVLKRVLESKKDIIVTSNETKAVCEDQAPDNFKEKMKEEVFPISKNNEETAVVSLETKATCEDLDIKKEVKEEDDLSLIEALEKLN